MRGFIKVIVQVLGLVLFSCLVNYIAHKINLKIPGSILALILVFILLKLKIVRLEWLEAGANWLLAALLLFFIPSSVGIVQYGELLTTEGFRLLIDIVFSTLIVMTLTDIITEFLMKHRKEANSK
ncbi:CidA/LrgA family protein [Effusibacillus dendaii]|uniref:Holin-like protein CidA n=1 Tax=Effusibacillus dendaii TaxID=2743772 RepID=A0A7I8DCN2_9BACL|nr:CidA/LrgA family holin-like protein [Effusibacillus dendaii]BCJ87953.1 holin-like protein CidA [Effusibacillus dendaii]